MNKLFFNKPLIIVTLIIILFFTPNLIMGKIPIPADSLIGLYHPWRDNSYESYNVGKFPVKNPLITDPVLQTYPWRYLSVENFKNGELPFWNPYNFLGQPLLANSQSAPFQIANVLFLVLPFKIAWASQIILPSLLTGLFMYLFLKSLKLSEPASIFGALVLPFSGFFVAWFTWGTVVTTAMWLPLILLCVNKLFQKISPFNYLLLIFALLQTNLSGHLQTASYVFLASFLYIIYKLQQSEKLKTSLLIIFGLVLAIIISAFQIIPTLEFINLSNRDLDQSYYLGRRDWFLPAQNLIQLVSPDYFGNPTTYNYWGVWNWAEFVGYVGILPLFLAGLVLIERNKKYSFFIFIALLSIVLSLANPISKLPYLYHLPFISSMQPSRIIFLLVFSLAVMASAGLDSFLKNKLRKSHVIFLVTYVFIILAIFAVTAASKNLFPLAENLNPQKIAQRNLVIPIILAVITLGMVILRNSKVSKNVVVGAVFLITIADLFRFGGKFTPFAKSSLIFPETKILSYLEGQKKPFRIMTTDRKVLHPNSNSVYGIESVDGYDPLFLKDYAQFVSSWDANELKSASSFNRIVVPQNYRSKITDLLNVKYIMSLEEISDPKFMKVLDEGETKIYENSNVLPRAFFASEVVKVANQNQQLQYLLNPDVDVKTSAVSSEFSYQKQDVNSNVVFDNYSDQNFTLSVFVDKDAPLIVSNPYYSGWQAYVDGEKLTINRVDFMFQSILIPAGSHKVEFKFKPKSFYNGLYISMFGVLLAALTSFALWRKKFL